MRSTTRLGKRASLAWLARFPNLVVLRTFSKAYGLAGLRVGFGVAHPEIVAAVDRVRPPFNVNAPAQAAAAGALADQAHVRRSAALARRERVRLAGALRGLGWRPVPSQANFVFAAVPGRSGQDMFRRLLRRGVIVRPFPGPYVRVTAGTPAQNDLFLQAARAARRTRA